MGERTRVLIAGGGVAALEALLAIGDLAEERPEGVRQRVILSAAAMLAGAA